MTSLCHLTAFMSFLIPFGNILGPLGFWLWKRKSLPETDTHGKESINFQISMTIYFAVYFAFCIGFFHWLTAAIKAGEGARYAAIFPHLYLLYVPLALIMLADYGLVIWAAIRAHQGREVRYPLGIRFIR